MKNKKFLLILMSILIAIVTIALVFGIINPEKFESNNKEQTSIVDGNKEIIELNGSELISVSFLGVSGNPSPNIIYSEIPYLRERITEQENRYSTLGPELAQNDNKEEIDKGLDKLDKYNRISVAAICTYDAGNLNLENGDDFVFHCQSDELKELGYKFDNTYSVKIENLPANTVNEITDNEQNYTTVVPEPEPEIVYKNYTVDKLGGVWMNSNVMDEGLPEEINNAKGKMIAVSSEEFEEAKEYALKNNIDMILVDDDIEYSIEDNFTNGEIFKGAGNEK